MILIEKANVSEDHRSDLDSVNDQLELVAARRLDQIDIFEEPYCRSKIAWKVAIFSNVMTHRLIALAEGVALSWNNANFLSAVLNARAMVETAASYWEFADQFSKLADASDFGGVDKLVTHYLFGTRDEELLEENPELKARQILNAIDLIDRTLIPHFRRHYDGLSEFCHPNSFGHRGLFSTIDKETGIASFRSKGSERFIHSVKCALGTVTIFQFALDAVARAIPVFAAAHHSAHPSPLIDENDQQGREPATDEGDG